MFIRKFQQRNIVWKAQADGGQQTETQQTTSTTEQSTTSATTENASGDANAQTQQANAEEKRFTQAELDAKIEDRLKRERESAKNKKAEEDAAAERKRLADDGKLKELSERQANDIVTLTADKETLTTKVTGLEEELGKVKGILEKQLTEQKKALPEPVQKLLNSLPLLDQMNWVAENAEKLGITVKGVPPTPKGEGTGTGNPVDDFISAQNNRGQEKK